MRTRAFADATILLSDQGDPDHQEQRAAPRSPTQIWGRGRISDAIWSADEQLIITAGSQGIYAYDTRNLATDQCLTQASDADQLEVDGEGRLLIATHRELFRWNRASAATAIPELAYAAPTGLALAAGGGTIALDDGDQISVSHLPSATLMAQLRLTSTGRRGSMSFSPGGRRLAVASAGVVVVWDLAERRVIAELRAPFPISLVAFGNDQATLVTAGSGLLCRWSLHEPTGYAEIAGDLGCVQGVALGPDGTIVAMTNDRLVFWRPEVALPVERPAPASALCRLRFNREGSRLLVATHDTLQIWNLRTLTLADERQDHWGCVGAVAFSPDRQSLAAVAGTTRVIALGPRRADHTILSLPQHGPGVAVAFAPDSRMLAIASDVALGLYRVGAANPVWRLPCGVAQSDGVGFTQDGRRLIVVTEHGVQIRSVRDGSLLRRLDKLSALAPGVPPEGATPLPADDVAIAPDGTAVATVTGSLVRLWDVETEELRWTLQAPAGLNGIALSAGGRRLAIACTEETQVWDTVDQALVRSAAAGAELVAISPGGTLLAAVWGAEIRLHRLAGQAPPLTLRGHLDAVTSLAFAHDDRRLLSGSRDGTLRLWTSDPPA